MRETLTGTQFSHDSHLFPVFYIFPGFVSRLKQHFFTLMLIYEPWATVDAWVKDFRYVSQSQIPLAFTVMALTCGNKQAALLVAAGRSIMWHMDLFANNC
jgi:hypothetical protein